jgi:hypothetical protein
MLPQLYWKESPAARGLRNLFKKSSDELSTAGIGLSGAAGVTGATLANFGLSITICQDLTDA